MARPLRIEFPGAVYHVTSRGDRREPIFADDEDRHTFLHILGQGMSRFGAQTLAYCLMGNHYHLVLHTRKANLSLLMRHVNGVYTQAFNRRHEQVGHLFQGRFMAILVDRDAYLLEVCRYVELNPVRASLVRRPKAWRWSSYRAHVGLSSAPEWLDVEGLHGYVLGRELRGAADGHRAAQRYAELVAAGGDVRLWDVALKQQIYLGDDAFVERTQAQADPTRTGAVEIPKAQRQQVLNLAQWLKQSGSREEALYNAYTRSGISMTTLAVQAGLSVSRISRLIARVEAAKGKA
jgi:REP element-mobilizing transposase RayT